ncbi:unnamed protein product [Amoebophrya sp. A25]|nr:unnamed protein product [Amoebophrya sp. A25]|eukprot:GSA25T00025515001.1
MERQQQIHVHRGVPPEEENRQHDEEQDPNTIYAIFADHDENGIWVYQALTKKIADFAVARQTLRGCKEFNGTRMTWIEPSFAWVLYRSGYARKRGQERVLKLQISHEAFCSILERCSIGTGGGGTSGRVQWDPERDFWEGNPDEKPGKEPRKMVYRRSIQIGIGKELSQFYTKAILRIEDVTELAHKVQEAHATMMTSKTTTALQNDAKRAFVLDFLAQQRNYLAMPNERRYMPSHLLSEGELRRLQLVGTEDIVRHHEEKKEAKPGKNRKQKILH